MANNAPYLADLFASVETGGDPTAEYLQMEVDTFNDMKRRGYLPASATFEDYITIDAMKKRSIANVPAYQDLTSNFYDYMQNVYGAQTPEQAALFSYRPGYLKRYGSVDNIPSGLPGSFGKDSKTVMQQRLDTLNKAGFTQ